MGLKSLFSKEGRKKRSLEKLCLKAANNKIKPDERMPALYGLLEETRVLNQYVLELKKDLSTQALSSEVGEAIAQADMAIAHLLKRLTFVYDTNIVNDEEEKNMVYQGLIDLGMCILPQVKKHLQESSTLSWGLRLVNEICDHETAWDILSEVIKNYDPEYERDPTRKLQLMTFLGDFKDARAVDALLPFLGDHDETVRFVTVESLFKQNDEKAREPLLALMTNEHEESFRIKNRIAEGFCELGWLTKGFRGTVEKILPHEFVLDSKGKIKLKKARE